jgi:hypothetical protein
VSKTRASLRLLCVTINGNRDWLMQQKSDHKGAAKCGLFICLHFLLLLKQVVWRELDLFLSEPKVAVFIVVLLEQRFWRRNSDVIDCFMMNTSNLMWSLYLSW